MSSLYHFRPTVLVILDGWGIAPDGAGNAIAMAKTPNFKMLTNQYPHGQLHASGLDVGLSKGEMGNSEVGHLNIGAGRVVFEDETRISNAITNGSFAKNKEILAAIEHQRSHKSAIHLIGLVGEGTVHSNQQHLFALLAFLHSERVEKIYIHLITDGRDSPPTGALQYVAELEKKITEYGATVASISGRFWAMDRDHRWDRVKEAYRAMTGVGGRRASSASEVIIQSYKNSISDEFIEPTTILSDGKPVSVNDGDSLIFFNYRPDRMREICASFVMPNFKEFPVKTYKDLFVLTFTQYHSDFPVHVAFQPEHVDAPLARIISENELTQIHIAETEKYAHVTYFLNGGREEPFVGEERILIPSPKISTYDLKPEMSAYEITEVAVKKITNGMFDLIVINYANADMVGHSGKIPETIKAVEVVDECLGKLVHAMSEVNGALVITADHGNAEQLIDPVTGAPDTAHTPNPVPIIICAPSLKGHTDTFLPSGKLADVAPTVLHLMGVAKPTAMTGRSLLDQ